MRALAYAAGLTAAFATASVFVAVQSNFDPLAMAIVLAAFTGVLWLAGMHPALGHPESVRSIERMLRIVIVTRIIASIFPCGICDMVCGSVAIEGVTNVDPISDPPPTDFVSTLAITALQGGFMLVQLALLLVFARSVERTWNSQPNPDICTNCGYDISASREFRRCPECGTPCLPPLASTGTGGSRTG